MTYFSAHPFRPARSAGVSARLLHPRDVIRVDTLRPTELKDLLAFQPEELAKPRVDPNAAPAGVGSVHADLHGNYATL